MPEHLKMSAIIQNFAKISENCRFKYEFSPALSQHYQIMELISLDQKISNTARNV